MTTFAQLGIENRGLEILSNHKIENPTPIQELVIPRVLKRESLLATSQTGSGKTLAFLLPLFQNLNVDDQSGTKSLILVPTRELAIQISSVAQLMAEAFSVSFTTIYGGVEYQPQIDALKNNPQLIIATPGRLIDLMEKGAVSLQDLSYFILDEADHMLDLGFRDAILDLAKFRAEDACTLCFSATLPEKVEQTIQQIAPNIQRLGVQSAAIAVDQIEQTGYFVEFSMMDALLLHLLKKEQCEHAILFTRSRKMADRLAKLLCENKISAEAMHADRSQVAREYILARFKSGETQLIVATDVIARGIDIDNVGHVFNYGFPQDAEQYVHRIGRTGRAGRCGKAITLSPPEEHNLHRDICTFMRKNIPMNTDHPYKTIKLLKLLEVAKKKGNN